MDLSVNKRHKGMTLIEVVVAAAIAAVLGTVMLTVLTLNSQQVKKSALNMKLCMQYDIAVSQIGKIARAAKYILSATDPCPPADSIDRTGITTIYMRNVDDVVMGGYRISGGYLQEFDPDENDFKIFKINPSDSGIKVASSPASSFTLSVNRKSVTVNLNVSVTYGGMTDVFTSRQEKFLCRN